VYRDKSLNSVATIFIILKEFI